MEENNTGEHIEFEWGKKRGIGVKNRDVQFYESFTYDGVVYTCFDSVYLYKEGEPEPYIGKLIKIWENPDKTKRVKVLWFFRPCEILNFLRPKVTCDNELFLACGEGLGLANVNPLPLLANAMLFAFPRTVGICNPPNEELQMADFVFYCFFDVGQRKILDKAGDKISGIEVRYLFNKLDNQKPAGIVKLGLEKKEISGKTIAANEAVAVDTLVRDNADSKPPPVKQSPLLGEKPTFSVGLEETTKLNDGLQMVGDKTIPQVEAMKKGVSMDSLVKQKSSSGQPCASKDRSRWFRDIPWDEKLKTAHDNGTLVLLQNLNPSISSREVEDIVSLGFNESCTAKMIQATAFSSPHSGQAFALFKTRAAAEAVVRKLDQGCLLLSNGCPLVGSIGLPCLPEKKPMFYGHIVLEQLRMQRIKMRCEMRDAVSTSHCAQPNNIEYEMAMEWCWLQERMTAAWNKLYQKQGVELGKLEAKLNSK